MAKTDFRTVDDYLATRSDEERAVLLRMQDAILSAVPEAEPAISYQLPAYKADGWIFYIFRLHPPLHPVLPASLLRGVQGRAGAVCRLQIRCPVPQEPARSLFPDLENGEGPGPGEPGARREEDGLTGRPP